MMSERLRRRSEIRNSTDRTTWNREYSETTAIPSSRRDDPSHALTEAVDSIDFGAVDRVLDVGCGNGRNAIYIASKGAEVTALDFSAEAIRLAQKRVQEEELDGSIDLVHADFLGTSAVEDDSIDLILDSYVSCHFLTPEVLDRFYAKVTRALRPGGLFYWSGLSTEDGYYQRLRETHPEEQIIVDPLNGVAKRLYTREEVESGFPMTRETIKTQELVFLDSVDGEEYQRVVLSGLYRI